MKNVFTLYGMLMLLSSSFAQADSLLRLACDDEDAGAVITLNGRDVGSCPADTFIPEGSYQVRVVKALSGGREQVFETQITLIEGQPKSVRVELSEPRLTAEAVQLQLHNDAMRTLALANNGDIYAMTDMSQLYLYGKGVEQSSANAAFWAQKAEDQSTAKYKQEFELQLRNAQAGDIVSMSKVAELYRQGVGVDEDPVQATLWKQKANTLSREGLLNIHPFFGQTKMTASEIERNVNLQTSPVDSLFWLGFSGTTTLPINIFSDVITSPSVTTSREKIKNAAVMRPSSWAKPDSMIAKFAQQSEIVVAQK